VTYAAAVRDSHPGVFPSGETVDLTVITAVPAFFIVLSSVLSSMRFRATAKLQNVECLPYTAWATAWPGHACQSGITQHNVIVGLVWVTTSEK
jgi:hypothetical protein